LKVSNAIIVCLFLVSTISAYPSVEAAQTTKIYQVTHPLNSVAGSQSPIPISVTVYFNDTTPGYLLVVGILDATVSPQQIVPGIVTSSTNPCLTQSQPTALCIAKVPTSSGVERIDFQIGGIFGGKHSPGNWNLNITSALFDMGSNLVQGSSSSNLFDITLLPVALNIIVPQSAVVSVDGVQQSPGPATVSVGLGQHNVTVPMLVQVNSTTRLRFDHWSDGSIGTTRTVLVNGNASLEADYVTQNLLTIIGPEQYVSGGGWYDANTSAPFSAIPSEPVMGPLGALGATMKFEGWYENGQLFTNSPNGTVSMGSPHTLTAVWQVDYSIPAAILLAIVAVIVIVYFGVRRKGKPRKRTSRRAHTRN